MAGNRRDPHHGRMSDTRSTDYGSTSDDTRPARHQLCLRRDTENKMLGGVCAGLAHAIDVDRSWVRLGFVIAALGAGPSIVIAYIIASCVIPAAADGSELRPAPPRIAHAMRIGLGLVALFSLFDVLDIGEQFGGPRVTPFGFDAVLGAALLIAAGAWLLSQRDDQRAGWIDDDPTYRPTPSDVSTSTAATSAPASSQTPPADEPAMASAFDPSSDTFLEDLYGPLPTATVLDEPDVRRSSGWLTVLRIVGWIGVLWFAFASLVTGALWLADIAEVRWPVLAALLAGAAVNVAFFALRTAKVARPLGALLLAAGLAAAMCGQLVSIPGAFGDRSLRPLTIAEVESRYRMAFGSLHLDLTAVEFPTARTTTIDVQVGGGEVNIELPTNVDVDVAAEVMGGRMSIFGRHQDGGRLDDDVSHRATVRDGDVANVSLRVRLGGGELNVRNGLNLDSPEGRLASGLPVLLKCTPGEGGATQCDHPTAELPELDCWVDGARKEALCRPSGLVHEIADPWPDDRGARHCTVPQGGGVIICEQPDVVDPAEETPDPPADDTRKFTCEQQADGTFTNCRPVEGSAQAA